MVIRNYNCSWCGNEFQADAVYSPPEEKNGRRVHHGSGNSIQCKKCFRLIPKFDKIKLENGGHIHIRGN